MMTTKPNSSPSKSEKRVPHSATHNHVGIKAGIMMSCVLGTMGGWVVLLEQNATALPTAISTIKTAPVPTPSVPSDFLAITPDGSQGALNVDMPTSQALPVTPAIDINQLRKVTVNNNSPATLRVVARTQSSR